MFTVLDMNDVFTIILLFNSNKYRCVAAATSLAATLAITKLKILLVGGARAEAAKLQTPLRGEINLLIISTAKL